MPPELEPVRCHRAVRYVFDYWNSLNRRRKEFAVITDLDIFAWSALRGIRLNAFELDVLDRIEEMYFQFFVKPKIDAMKQQK